ncbi:MAG: hypothetical protein K9M02_13935 [Thiohalocapsa sp.]|nr:hypothetical protein [Thiohalocapsa sp.]
MTFSLRNSVTPFAKPAALCLYTLIALSGASVAVAGDDHEDHDSPFEGQPLLTLMHNMQYYGHKLGLAIDAGNRELQGFYVHELEEVIEAVEEIESYDGIAIPTLLESTFERAFEGLEGAIEVGDAERIDAAYDGLLNGCNECHRGANRPYIVIKRSHDNPYPQDFAPRPSS